jgi:hypothetical protein
MSRIACSLLLVAALPLAACSKAANGGAAAAPVPDLATPGGLTSTVASKLTISETQANAAIGSILGQAQGNLSPEDYTKLSSAIPGADSYLSAATAAGVGPAAAAKTGESADSIAPNPGASADSVAADAAGAVSAQDQLASNMVKLQIPTEAAKQLVPVVTAYVNQVAGPNIASLLKSVF